MGTVRIDTEPSVESVSDTFIAVTIVISTSFLVLESLTSSSNNEGRLSQARTTQGHMGGARKI